MSFKRKFKRSKIDRSLYCCGKPMTRKESFDTAATEIYFCEKCGRKKLVLRSVSENE